MIENNRPDNFNTHTQPQLKNTKDTSDYLVGKIHQKKGFKLRAAVLLLLRGKLFQPGLAQPPRISARKQLQNLNSVPLSRHDTKLIAQRLVLRHGNPEKIKASLDRIFSMDQRFNGGATDKFRVDPRTKRALIAEIDALPHKKSPSKTHKVSSDALPHVNVEKQQPAKLTAFDKQIASSLIGLVERRPATHHFIKTKTTLHQVQGHTRENKWESGKTISAEVQKSESHVGEIANQGYIATGPLNKPNNILLSRSARTDTREKIVEKSIGDIAARLSTSKKNGLVLMRDSRGPYYAYQRTDTTLMDTSLWKSIGTSLASLTSSSPSEDERKFVANKKKAVAAEWKSSTTVDESGRYIERMVKDHTGKEYRVREYEPIVLNFVFSGQAKSAANVADARKSNIPGQLTLLTRLNSRVKVLESGLIEKCVTKPSPENLKALAHALDSVVQDNPKLTASEKLALIGLRITLTGKDNSGRSYDNELGSAQQYLLASVLADEANSAFSIECKSGNDRTATAMALKVAQKVFEETTGRPFDPTKLDSGGEDFKLFSDLFTEAIIAFAKPNLEASRGVDENGVPDIKVASSPAFRHFADTAMLAGHVNIV